MTTRSRVLLRRTALGIGLVVVAVTLAIGLLLGTSPGARLAASVARSRLPAGITFERVSGPLRGPFAIHGLRLATPAADVTVARIEVDWRLRGLLKRSLDVDRLEISDVDVRLRAAEPAAEPEAPPGPLPELRFPLELRLHDGRADRIAIHMADSAATTWAIDSVRTSVTLLRDGVRIDHLAVRGPAVSAGLDADVQTAGAWPLRGRIDWALLLPDSLRLAGAATAEGEADGELRIVHRLDAPVRADLQATLRDVRRELRIGARVTLPDQRIEGLVAGAPPVRVGGWVESEGAIDALTIRGLLDTDVAPAGPLRTSFLLARDARTLRIDSLDIVAPGTRTRLAAAGTVLLDSVPEFDVRLRWRELAWPLRGPAAARTPEGRLEVKGTADAYRFAIDALADAGQLRAVPVSGRGSGNSVSADLERVRADLLEGSVTASGRVAWSPGPEWRLAVTASGIQPAPLAPRPEDWPGRIDLRATTSGRIRGARTTGRIDVSEMTGDMRGRSLAGTLRASFSMVSGGRVIPSFDIDTAFVDWGELELDVRGSVTESIDLALTLVAPDLSLAVPGAAGGLELTAIASGTPREPRLIAEAETRDVAFQEIRVASARLTAAGGLAPHDTVRLSGSAFSLGFGERAVDSLAIDVDGTRALHSIRLRAMAPDSLDVALRAVGGLEGVSWAGRLEDLDLAMRPLGRWRLEEPAEIAASAKGARLGPLCLASEPADLCASAGWSAEGPTVADIRLGGLPIDRFRAWLPEGWEATGSLDLNGRIGIAAGGSLEGVAAGGLRGGSISLPFGDARDTIVVSLASFDGAVGPEGAVLRAGAALDQQDGTALVRIDADLVLPEYRSLRDSVPVQPLRGRLEADAADLTFLATAMPAVDSLAGRITAAISLSGTVGSPAVTGEMTFAEGRVALPALGLTITDIEARARGEGTDSIMFVGSARSGGGTVELRGTSPMLPSAESPVRLEITGRRFQVMNSPEIRVWASPTLQVAATPARVAVTGDVIIPRAEIELTEIPETAVPPSADVVFVGDTMAVARGPEIDARVRVTLGDSVNFRGFGFAARPTGGLLVSQQPGQVATGTGEISLQGGRFRAYGQDLTLERGRVLFGGGPVTDAGMDMRAVRNARDGTVAGLEIRGTLLAPDVQLFSEPPMTQSEALSYVILGRPLGQASAAEGSRLTSAATSLGLKGGNLLAGRIGARFGLEDMRIETGEELEQASLVAGRYLTPRLYVAYGIGLFRPVSTYRITYLLASRWTLQAESGDATGADLLYRLERGR